MTYAELIASAMRGRGKMENTDIYLRVAIAARGAHRKLSPHWKAVIRNTLQRHCKTSSKFIKPNLFIHHDRSIWSCKK